MFSELVLTAAAFVMMAHLIKRRLAHIDHCQPDEMMRDAIFCLPFIVSLLAVLFRLRHRA
jgi:hypothetical protein